MKTNRFLHCLLLIPPPHLSMFECCCVLPSLFTPGSVSSASNCITAGLHSFCGWGTARVWALEVMILQISDSPYQVTVVTGSIWWTQKTAVVRRQREKLA